MPRGMPEGHSTTIEFSDFPNISFWEKTVTPPGMEGGEPIDTTTMYNEAVKTKWPQTLIEITGMAVTAAYKPELINECYEAMNYHQVITITFPTTGTASDYGWLRNFKPNRMETGTQPTAEIMVEFSGETGASPVVETGITYIPPA